MYDPIIRVCQQRMKASLEEAKKKSVGATEASLVALAIGLRTIFEMLDVLDKGTFDTPRSLSLQPSTTSRDKAKENIDSIRRNMFSHELSLKILKAVSFGMDIMLPAPVEIAWKLFVQQGD